MTMMSIDAVLPWIGGIGIFVSERLVVSPATTGSVVGVGGAGFATADGLAATTADGDAVGKAAGDAAGLTAGEGEAAAEALGAAAGLGAGAVVGGGTVVAAGCGAGGAHAPSASDTRPINVRRALGGSDVTNGHLQVRWWL